MKINFQKLMRVLPSLTTVFVILAMCALPAFAAPTEVNIWDYATITVDGLTKEVVIEVPQSWNFFSAHYGGNEATYVSGSGSSSNLDLTGMKNNCTLYVSPLGTFLYQYTSNPSGTRYLNLSDIPNGSELSMGVEVRISPDENASLTVQSQFLAGFVDGANYSTQAQTVPVVKDQDVYSINCDYVLTNNQLGFVPQAKFTFRKFPDGDFNGIYYVSLGHFTITTTLDALKQLQDSVDQSNAILDEIKEQMNINNQNLQDFLDGKKEWQDIVDASTDKVEDSVGDMNEIGDALATIPKPEIDIETLVPDELAGQQYLNYTAALSRLWENPIISTVAYIMGCLLIFSYLLFGERG